MEKQRGRMREESTYIDTSSFIPKKSCAKISPSFPHYTHQTSEDYKLHAALFIHYENMASASSILWVTIQIKN
jgi:hypothetical protein